MKNYLQEKFSQKMLAKKYEKKKPIYFINLALITCVICFGTAYFLQINNISSKGYQMRDLEKAITVLEEENNDLALEIINLQSLATIQEKAAGLDLVRVDNVEYLSVTSSVMAKK